MSKFTSLLLSNIIVVLGFIFSSSLDKGTSFIHEILLFIWALNILLVIIIIILMMIDNTILKSKKWKYWILLESIVLFSLLLFSKHIIYLYIILGITQSIKYTIYNRYLSNNKEKKDEQ